MSRKSKLGCKTCRQRRVKCDETLPICRRCITSRRHCDGPFRNKFVLTNLSASSKAKCMDFTSVVLPDRFPLLPDLDATESRSFDFFLSRVAPTLAGELDASFWTILLPQISRENRAVRYAVLSMSQLFEAPPYRDTHQVDSLESSSHLAHQWYAQSLSTFRSSLEHLPNNARYDLLLLSCILFINIEFQQNNVYNACKLLKSGFSMIETLKPARDDDNLNVLIRMLKRQEALVALFGHHQGIQDERDLEASPSRQYSPDILTSARQDLFLRLSDVINFTRAIRIAEALDEDTQSFQSTQRLVLQRLDCWYRNFGYLFHQHGSMSNVTSRTLIMYYDIAKVFASICLGPEKEADAHMTTFARIINLAEEIIQQNANQKTSLPSYSFELGISLPLYLTGWKCRNPIMRRKALCLMSRCPKQEALISADIHARALQKIIEIEERNLCAVATRSQDDSDRLPSENCRIRSLTTHYETYEGKKVAPRLIYDLSRYGQDSKFVQHTVLI